MSQLMLDDEKAMSDINPFADTKNFFPPGTSRQNNDYKKRLIQLGENPKTIFNYGGLGAHSIKNSTSKDKKIITIPLRTTNEQLKAKIKELTDIIKIYNPPTVSKAKEINRLNKQLLKIAGNVAFVGSILFL